MRASCVRFATRSRGSSVQAIGILQPAVAQQAAGVVEDQAAGLARRRPQPRPAICLKQARRSGSAAPGRCAPIAGRSKPSVSTPTVADDVGRAVGQALQHGVALLGRRGAVEMLGHGARAVEFLGAGGCYAATFTAKAMVRQPAGKAMPVRNDIADELAGIDARRELGSRHSRRPGCARR